MSDIKRIFGIFFRVIFVSLKQILLIYTLIFVVMHLSGGQALANDLPIPIDQKQEMIQAMGLNDPLLYQYIFGLKNLLTLNWGYSFFNRFIPLYQLIATALLNTSILATLSLLIAIPIAYILAFSAYFIHNLILRNMFILIIYLLGALPSMIVAPTLFWLVSKHQPGAFIGGLQWQRMPWLGLSLVTLSLPYITTFAKLIYNYLCFQMQWHYFLQLKALGFSLFNRLWLMRAELTVPIISYLAAAFSQLLSGAMLIETTFKIHGLGQLSVQAMIHRDYPVIMMSSLLFALATEVLHQLSQLWMRRFAHIKDYYA